MTSCKPPPTCIDASPIPDANDSRMSAIPYEANLTPMGVSPPRAPRTVRDTLASYGSRCSAIPMQKAPMRKQMRVGPDDPRQPVSCTFGPLMQSLELVARPADQEGINPMQSRGQLRLVEVAVVVDPACTPAERGDRSHLNAPSSSHGGSQPAPKLQSPCPHPLERWPRS